MSKKIKKIKSRDITLPTEVCLVKAMVFPVVMYRCESWTIKKVEHEKVILLSCGAGEDSWEFHGQQGNQTNQSWRKSVLTIHWKDSCQNWISYTLATCSEELNHWKRPWCWETLRAGEGGDARGGNVWMASLTQWTWVWIISGSQWRTGKPSVPQSMGSQRVGHNWMTE